MTDEQVFGSADGKHRSDKPELRLLLVGPHAWQRLWLLQRTELQLLRKELLL